MTQDLDALPLPEPLALLHTGDDFGGERDDPELEFNSFNAAAEFCLSKPAKTKVGLHTDDALRDYGQRCYELAKREAQEGREPVAWLTREQIDSIMTQHYPLDSLLRENVDAFEACVRDIEKALFSSPPPKSDEARDAERWRAAVMTAYGHLWHVNNDPIAPIPLRSPEKAAYEARKALRDLLTSQERGDAINAVGVELGVYDAALAAQQAKGEA